MLCRVETAGLEIGKSKVVLHEEAVALAVTYTSSEHQVGHASWCRSGNLGINFETGNFRADF